MDATNKAGQTPKVEQWGAQPIDCPTCRSRERSRKNIPSNGGLPQYWRSQDGGYVCIDPWHDEPAPRCPLCGATSKGMFLGPCLDESKRHEFHKTASWIRNAAKVIDKKVLRYDTREIEADPIKWLCEIIGDCFEAQPSPAPSTPPDLIHRTLCAACQMPIEHENHDLPYGDLGTHAFVAAQSSAPAQSQSDELQELRAWKESAMKQLGKADLLRAVLPMPDYLGWDTYEATIDYVKRLTAPAQPVNQAVLEALRKYGRHTRECSWNSFNMATYGKKCDCGLAKAVNLAEAVPAVTTTNFAEAYKDSQTAALQERLKAAEDAYHDQILALKNTAEMAEAAEARVRELESRLASQRQQNIEIDMGTKLKNCGD